MRRGVSDATQQGCYNAKETSKYKVLAFDIRSGRMIQYIAVVVDSHMIESMRTDGSGEEQQDMRTTRQQLPNANCQDRNPFYPLLLSCGIRRRERPLSQPSIDSSSDYVSQW